MRKEKRHSSLGVCKMIALYFFPVTHTVSQRKMESQLLNEARGRYRVGYIGLEYDDFRF